MMKELHLLMEEDYFDDIRADDTVLKVSNITLDCDLALPAILRHEPADMDINAVYNLIPQPSVILPFNCDQNSADQAVVSGGNPQLMATISFFTSDGVNLKSGYLSMTSLQSPNGNDCGQGVIQDFISDFQEDDDHGYSDSSFEDDQAQGYSSDGQ